MSHSTDERVRDTPINRNSDRLDEGAAGISNDGGHRLRTSTSTNSEEDGSAPISPAGVAVTVDANDPPRTMRTEQFNFESEEDISERVDRLALAMRTPPQGKKVQCRIIRYKATGMEMLYPQYDLYLDDDDDKSYLLTARKRKTTGMSQYVILSERKVSSKQKEYVVGKIRSNFLGTSFVAYGPGRNPLKNNPKKAHLPPRQELIAVLYEPNLLGKNGPRKMTVLLPAMDPETNEQIEVRPTKESECIIDRHKAKDDHELLVLHNKIPQWNDETQTYILNFSGRVLLTSVKNFQVVHDDDLEYLIVQFGRVTNDTFTVDCVYPMSPLQAFAVALSSFDTKLACE